MPVFGTYWSGLADGALSDAGKVAITDTGGSYTSTNVDGALDEIADGTTLDGRYMAPFGAVSGGFVGPRRTSATSRSMAQNVLFYVPILWPGGTAVSIACNVVTNTASSTVRMGIYTNLNGRPASLIVDAGTVDTSTTGVKSIVISEALDAGPYWLAAVQQGAASAPTLTGYASAIDLVTTNQTFAITSTISSITEAGVSGALPSSATAVTDYTSGPTVVLEID